jgi:hypothetical protein
MNSTHHTKGKSNSREKKLYPALDPNFNLKSRTDLIDYDYLNKLNPEELAWLNKFTEEYVNAKLNKNSRKNLHNKKKLRSDCYSRNNRRNKCILTRAKAGGYLKDIELLKNKSSSYNEEDLINEIDRRTLNEFNKKLKPEVDS